MSSEHPRERDDSCGQELVPEEGLEDLAEEYDPDEWYEDGEGGHYCDRKVWNDADTNRCIWHAKVDNKPPEALSAAKSEGPARLDRAVLRGSDLPLDVSLSDCRLRNADFNGADLERTDLSGAALQEADLRNANLQGADLSNTLLREADLSNADVRHADLSHATLEGADLSPVALFDADLGGATLQRADLGSSLLQNADLSHATLWEANLRDAALREANLEGATLRKADLGGGLLWETDLTGADLRDANLKACRLHLTTFDDATIDESTNFGASSGHERKSDREAETKSRVGERLSGRLRGLGRPFTSPAALEQAEIQYRTVQRIKREYDLKPDLDLEIREKHARRKRALAERRYWDWFKLAFYRWPMGYGEKPTHVVATSIAVVLAAMLAYPHAGGFERTAGATTPVADLSQALAVPEAVTSAVGPWLTSFYFSVVTFTTVGYGDLQPATEMGRLLASVESFLGALLMALLVFVLGRRATW